jgi:predicted RNase H-like HicB family nuclease
VISLVDKPNECYNADVIGSALKRDTLPHKISIELEQETDGRWIAEIPELPGVMAYGSTRSGAAQAVKALALRVLADQLEEEKNTGCSRLSFSNNPDAHNSTALKEPTANRGFSILRPYV